MLPDVIRKGCNPLRRPELFLENGKRNAITRMRQGLSAHIAGIRQMVFNWKGMFGFHWANPLAEWIRVSRMQKLQGLADVIGFDTMFKMFAQSLNTCRYNLPWNKEAPEIMVSSDVVYNKPEIRRKCITEVVWKSSNAAPPWCVFWKPGAVYRKFRRTRIDNLYRLLERV